MTAITIQDTYPDDIAICYGCGKHNPKGWHIQTQWDGKEGILRFTPKEEHTAYPGIVYGGLIAGLIDCHSVGTAVAAMYAAEGRIPGSLPPILCVTGNLNVTYLKPTPMGYELLLRAHIKKITNKKAVVDCVVVARGEECAKGQVVAIRVPPENLKLKVDREISFDLNQISIFRAPGEQGPGKKTR